MSKISITKLPLYNIAHRRSSTGIWVVTGKSAFSWRTAGNFGSSSVLDAQRQPVVSSSGFQVSSTGEVRTTMGLSRNPPARFVAVRISDHGTPTLSSTVTLTINVACPPASIPTFQQQYYCAGLPENSPINTEITRVKVSHEDRVA